MVKIISSYYNRIPLTLHGKKVYRPHKNYISTVRCSDIEIPDDIYQQIILDSDLYTETIYNKDNPEEDFFNTNCILRSNMPIVIDRCDAVINYLCYSYKEYCMSHDKSTMLKTIESLSYVRTLIYNVYNSNGNFYIEVLKR